MRRREDADGLKGYLKLNDTSVSRSRHVLIVGGGLLGLELADALREGDGLITTVQRANRLL